MKTKISSSNVPTSSAKMRAFLSQVAFSASVGEMPIQNAKLAISGCNALSKDVSNEIKYASEIKKGKRDISWFKK